MYEDYQICPHCREVVRISDMIGDLCRWCDSETYNNEDLLAGDVDRHPEQLVAVTYPGPNGPEVHYEPERSVRWCDICRGDVEPGAGRVCYGCCEDED